MIKRWSPGVMAVAMLLPCASRCVQSGAAVQNTGSGRAEEQDVTASGAMSLMVCDPPTFENCHRMVDVTPPKVIHSETPAYPGEARRLGMEGVSEVRFVIDPEGVPRNVTTAHSIAETVPASQRNAAVRMDRSAVACVKKFRFKPATLKGKPVATQVNVKMRFHRTMAK